jgi:uncharacterized caspase-like protein
LTLSAKSFAALLAACLFFLSATTTTRAQTAEQSPRIALVIGNSAYSDHPLATPANDAGLIAQTLQAAGFDVVGARDVDEKTLRGALRDFLDKAASIGPDMQAFVYLAGRGVQYEGDNYFVPVDARLSRDADIPIEAVKIADFSRALAALPGRARIVVLDAARANSYAANGPALAGGLALVDAEAGALIAFNAAPGTIAPDEAGPYGIYGKAMAGAMRQGGLPIAQIFAQTRVLANQQTNGAVVPWSVSKIDEPYFIFDRAPDAPAPVAAAPDLAKRPLRELDPETAYAVVLQRDSLAVYQDYVAAFPDGPLTRRVRAILAARREAIFWRRSVDDNSPRAYWTYLRVYPKGPHVFDARRRLQLISAQFQPPRDFAPLDYPDLPPPPSIEIEYESRPTIVFDGPDYGPPPSPPPGFLPERDDRWRDLPPPPPPAGVGFLPVLPMAIPLMLGARPAHRPGAPEGVREERRPGSPPPLPHGFRPAERAPGGAATQPPGPPKPLPPIPTAPAAVQTPTPPKPPADASGLPRPLKPADSTKPASGASPPVVKPELVSPIKKPMAQPTAPVGGAPLPPTKAIVAPVKPTVQPSAPMAPPPKSSAPLAAKPAMAPPIKPAPPPIARVVSPPKPPVAPVAAPAKPAATPAFAPHPAAANPAPPKPPSVEPSKPSRPVCGAPNTPRCPIPR